MLHLLKIFFSILCFESLVEAQSGDADWLIPVALDNETTQTITHQTSFPPPNLPLYPYYDYDQPG